MAKLIVYHKISALLMFMLFAGLPVIAQYRLEIAHIDKTDAFISDTLKLQQQFASKISCINYVNKLPAFFLSKGYPNASVDSVAYDSTTAYCVLYIGEPLRYTYINTDSIDPALLSQVGWNK